jgi:hypothetical protein
MSQMSPAKAQRARENRAYVRVLLRERQPAFAAALEFLSSSMSCSACPARGRIETMIAHRFHRLDDHRFGRRGARLAAPGTESD